MLLSSFFNDYIHVCRCFFYFLLVPNLLSGATFIGHKSVIFPLAVIKLAKNISQYRKFP